MSTAGDVHAFLTFLEEVFVEKEHCLPAVTAPGATCAGVEDTIVGCVSLK